jgi:tetratricopeptide (TPR) repeat protein
MPTSPSRRLRLARQILPPILLLLLAAAIFARTAGHSFTNYDDNSYVTANDRVTAGLTLEGAAWAFRTFAYSNWHPLTWLSHMADAQLFGAWAGGHHLVSALIHAATGALLFLVLRALTGSAAAGFVAAALFVVHPQHVESVAWASERKDVLCGLLWAATMGTWLLWLRRPSPGRYLVVAASFGLALMAKPMAVTLPFVLLLLDWWPAGRLRRMGDLPRLGLEKAPLLAMAAASSVVTVLAQKSGGSVSSLAEFPLAVRLANAVRAYAFYVGKALWPANLTILYPAPPETIAWGPTIASVALLAALLGTAILLARRLPALLAGWLWFLGTLVPVIGLVQLEQQAPADRYTYLPLVGPFLAAGVLVATLAARSRRSALGAGLVTAAVVAALAVASFRQVPVWRDSVSLFGHALRVNPESWAAHNQYGSALISIGREAEGRPHILEGLRLNPVHRAEMHFRSGIYYAERGMYREARASFERALAMIPPEMSRKADVVRRALAKLERETTVLSP